MVASGWLWRMASAALRPAMPEPTITWRVLIGSPRRRGLGAGPQGDAFEAEHAARTAADALAAGQAIAGVDGPAAAGAGADVDADGAIVGADAALHAAGGLGHDLGLGQRLASRRE